MPSNLSPEILAWLQSQGVNPDTLTRDGQTYHMGISGGSGGVEQGQTPMQTDYYLQDLVAGRNQAGDMQNVYNTQGNYQTTHAVPKQSLIPMEIALPLLAAAGGYAMWGGGAGAGAAGASGAASGGIGTMEALPLMEVGMSELPMYSMGGVGAAGGAAAGMGGGGATAAGANVAGNMMPSAMSGAGGLGGLLGQYGGLAATALGALAGSQGSERGTTETRSVPDWVKRYYDNGQGGGVLPMAMGLLQQQNSPERMAQWDQMRNTGMGLLNTQRQQYFGPQHYFAKGN